MTDKYYDPNLNLKIKDLTIKDKSFKIHDDIPEVPFNLCCYGKSASGKTNLIINLLLFYKKVFKNRVIIFTKSRNGSLYSLEEKIGAKIFNSLYNENGNIIEEVLEFQRTRKEENEKLKNILILFDDWITDESFNRKRNVYDKLYSMARHFNISVITTSQQYTLLPSSIRRLSWYDIIFKISNQSERKTMIYEECSAIDKNEKEFEEIYNDCVKEPFSFIYIDKKNGKYLKRFGV
jgi:hypothetical protein